MPGKKKSSERGQPLGILRTHTGAGDILRTCLAAGNILRKHTSAGESPLSAANRWGILRSRTAAGKNPPNAHGGGEHHPNAPNRRDNSPNAHRRRKKNPPNAHRCLGYPPTDGEFDRRHTVAGDSAPTADRSPSSRPNSADRSASIRPADSQRTAQVARWLADRPRGLSPAGMRSRSTARQQTPGATQTLPTARTIACADH